MDEARPAGDAIIRFQGVSVRFGDADIYRGLDFEVAEGEFVCILGPSGCGKSTSLRLIGDLLPASEGRVTVAGRTPAEAWSEIAYIFQSPRLVPWRTALGNVVLGMQLRHGGGDRRAMERRAREHLALVGLAADADKYPRMLSGGERQRVAIARSLAVVPRSGLMREPFSALDLNTRRRLREETIQIWQATAKTIVFVTHDIDEALVLADRILLLSNKPTRVLEEIRLNDPRPRSMEAWDELRRHRAHLHELFRRLEPEAAPPDATGEGETR